MHTKQKASTQEVNMDPSDMLCYDDADWSSRHSFSTCGEIQSLTGLSGLLYFPRNIWTVASQSLVFFFFFASCLPSAHFTLGCCPQTARDKSIRYTVASWISSHTDRKAEKSIADWATAITNNPLLGRSLLTFTFYYNFEHPVKSFDYLTPSRLFIAFISFLPK